MIDRGSLKNRLSRFLLRYYQGSTPNSTIGEPPAQLLMKHHLFIKLDLVSLGVEDNKQSVQKAVIIIELNRGNIVLKIEELFLLDI